LSNALDDAILEALLEDARMSFRQIAKKTGKSTDTIISHYNNLVESGIIKGSTLVLNLVKVGYEAVAAIGIDVENSETADSVLEALSEIKNIFLVTKTLGEHDVLALVVIQGVKQLQKKCLEISAVEGVKHIYPSIWAIEGEIMPEYFAV